MTNQERLALMTKGIRDICRIMDVFILGGGLSTSLDGIVPAVVVAVIGELVIDKPLTKPFKNPGDKIILIGETDDDGNDTVFRAGIAGEMKPAKALFNEEKTSMLAALAAIRIGLLQSLSDLGAAGIGAAVCEAAKYSGFGAEVELSNVPTRENRKLAPAELILNETQARYCFTVPSKNVQSALSAIKDVGGMATVIGEVEEANGTTFKYDGRKVAFVPNQPSEKTINFLNKM